VAGSAVLLEDATQDTVDSIELVNKPEFSQILEHAYAKKVEDSLGDLLRPPSVKRSRADTGHLEISKCPAHAMLRAVYGHPDGAPGHPLVAGWMICCSVEVRS
jgi:hypothetical protein